MYQVCLKKNDESMIESIQFKNLKVLREATLPLSRCTVLIGANGSGKNTVFQALQVYAYQRYNSSWGQIVTVGSPSEAEVQVTLHFAPPDQTISWLKLTRQSPQASAPYRDVNFKIYSLDARAIPKPVLLQARLELAQTGQNLAGVLDRIRDEQPERFE